MESPLGAPWLLGLLLCPWTLRPAGRVFLLLAGSACVVERLPGFYPPAGPRR